MNKNDLENVFQNSTSFDDERSFEGCLNAYSTMFLEAKASASVKDIKCKQDTNPVASK